MSAGPLRIHPAPRLPFKMGQIPQSLRGEWWRADDLADGVISSWTGRWAGLIWSQGVSGSRGTKSSTSFNGHPALSLDGTDDYYDLNTPASTPAGLNDRTLIMTVDCKDPALASTTFLRIGNNTNGGMWGMGNTPAVAALTNRLNVNVGNSGFIISDGSGVNITGPHVLATRQSSAAIRGRINGAQTNPSSLTVASNIIATRGRLGSGVAATALGFPKCSVRDIVILRADNSELLRNVSADLAWSSDLQAAFLPPYDLTRP